ncbi:orf18 [Lactobacillus phage LP65]|uniref:Orf18 n=1 Tax=Lactobacillus phage LP65 TaxID=2892344 RepID=Q5ULU6_9CAUD|nr:hypothetical protein LP65_gp018 [Lactobacillus phage LP65]AAV35838.1 orf18 [Lactobacillus phage LP65]
MKIKYDDIDETKPRWKVGDVIYSADSRGSGLYLVAEVDDLDGGATKGYSYTLINLESGYSVGSYGTVDELQRHVYHSGDMILDGTFKYTEND